ncbi:MAG: hypothetical protein HOP02_15215 [Methylococcaceae bacterium]|nr:hypothetical protein [Methylococcaceae bacterium]
MSEPPSTPAPDQKKRLLDLFGRILPLVDGMADKLRFVLVIGVLLLIWIGTWLLVIKHVALGISLVVIGLALLPLLILLRFWWALEELKDLPNIAGQMMGDAKDEIRESVRGIRAGDVSKLNFVSATKGLWSLGSMLKDSRELLGSYISLSTLVNPFMLILGVLSLGSVLVLMVVSIVLVFLAL